MLKTAEPGDHGHIWSGQLSARGISSCSNKFTLRIRVRISVSPASILLLRRINLPGCLPPSLPLLLCRVCACRSPLSDAADPSPQLNLSGLLTGQQTRPPPPQTPFPLVLLTQRRRRCSRRRRRRRRRQGRRLPRQRQLRQTRRGPRRDFPDSSRARNSSA